MLQRLLQDSLVHATKNVDAFVLEGTATEEVAGILHFCTLFPSDFFVLCGILEANVMKSITAYLNRLEPLVGVSVVTTNNVDIFVSDINSSMPYTANIEYRMLVQSIHALINLVDFFGRAVAFGPTN